MYLNHTDKIALFDRAFDAHPTDEPRYQEIVARSALDTNYFSKVVMADVFDHCRTDQHDQAWNLLDDERVLRSVLCAWRGFGKTTMFLAKVIKSILFRQRCFILYIGQTYMHAQRVTENIKMELLHNPCIRELWGNFKAKKWEGVDIGFAKSDWFACDPVSGEPVCFIMPRGSNQQVRGLNVRMFNKIMRPDLILFDDPEKDSEIDNEEMRFKFKRYLHGSALNVMDKKKKYVYQGNDFRSKWLKKMYGRYFAAWRVLYADTPKHEDARITWLMDDKHWKSLRLPVARAVQDPNNKDMFKYYSLVPELISDKEIAHEVKINRDNGTMPEFWRESMVNPTPQEGKMWTRDMFKYYSESQRNMNRNVDLYRFVITDPARTVNRRSAYSAAIAFAVDIYKRKIYARYLMNARLHAADYARELVDLCVMSNSRTLFYEETGLESHLENELNTEISSRPNIEIELIPLKSSLPKAGDYGSGREAIKRARVGNSHHLYDNDIMVHNNDTWPAGLRDSPLEKQLLSYPRPKQWDAADCFGHLPAAMEKIDIVFAPNFSNSLKDPKPDEFDDHDSWESMTQDIGHGVRMYND